LEAREYVLEHSSKHVVSAGHAVGSWRPFVENPWLCPLAIGEAALEYIKVTPALKNAAFELCWLELVG
jgi:hypothetical protein